MIMDINQPFVTQEHKFKYWEESKAEIQTLRAKVTSAEELVEALSKIARISHMGGLIDMSEADAWRAIRKITLPYFNTKESFDEAKKALATYDKISEVKHE